MSQTMSRNGGKESKSSAGDELSESDLTEDQVCEYLQGKDSAFWDQVIEAIMADFDKDEESRTENSKDDENYVSEDGDME